ncbi:unnamed protein product [Lupinus luteus]|uniref:AP2/ERF domain-containing protein n=1 Tax=Lupinus luteus TaxID=3873 RepID=A0AAV1WMK6_LUPLU
MMSVSKHLCGITPPSQRERQVGCYGNEIYEMQTMNKNDFIIKVRWKVKGNNTGSHTPYRGVYRIQDSRSWGAWLSQEDNDFPKIFLGTYYTAEDAARAHDVAQIKFKGMDAIINFELSSYDIKSILYSNAKTPTAKKVPTYNDILMNKVSSEALSSPSNTFFESHPLKLTLSNTSMSTFCGSNPNPSGFKLGGRTGLSQARASGTNAINGSNTSFGMLFPSQGSQGSQTQTMKLNPTMYQYIMKKRSYNEASSSSSFPNEQPLNKQMRMFSNNFFSFQSNPSISGAMYPNQGTNVEQPLTENYSSSTLDGSQNHNLMQNSSYNLGGLTGTGSMVGTNDNSIVDNGAMIPNQGANVELPLTQNNPNDLGLGIGQDFQSPTQIQNNQLDDIINSEFYQYILNNNQALLQTPNLSFSECNLPELPSDFEIQLPPLVGTGLQGIDAEATATQEQYDAGIFLNNQSFPQSPGVNLVHHDGNQNLDLQNDLTSNFPSENSPTSSFSTSFLNLHSEINTASTSLNQVLEYLENTPDLCPDPNTSNESFQNLISETNTSSHGNMTMTKKQDGLGTTQCVSNFDDLFHDPISETNTGSQIPTPGSQNDLNISDYLSDCYAVEEEADWIHHFGSDFGQQ